MYDTFIPIEPQLLLTALISKYPRRSKIRPKHPEININLFGCSGDGNYLLSQCVREMEKKKLSVEEIETFISECHSGDYLNLLKTFVEWFSMNELNTFAGSIYYKLESFDDEFRKSDEK